MRQDHFRVSIKRQKELPKVTPHDIGKALEQRLNTELNPFGVYIDVEVLHDYY